MYKRNKLYKNRTTIKVKYRFGSSTDTTNDDQKKETI